MKNASTLGYFNSAQAIADYADVLLHIRKKYSAERSPLIVVGGSYGGSKSLFKSLFITITLISTINKSCKLIKFLFFFFVYISVLAAWFRLKYPHIALGALASSAPILYFHGIAPKVGYYTIVTKDFKVIRNKILIRQVFLSVSFQITKENDQTLQ